MLSCALLYLVRLRRPVFGERGEPEIRSLRMLEAAGVESANNGRMFIIFFPSCPLCPLAWTRSQGVKSRVGSFGIWLSVAFDDAIVKLCRLIVFWLTLLSSWSKQQTSTSYLSRYSRLFFTFALCSKRRGPALPLPQFSCKLQHDFRFSASLAYHQAVRLSSCCNDHLGMIIEFCFILFRYFNDFYHCYYCCYSRYLSRNT